MLSAVLFDMGETLFYAEVEDEREAARAQWRAIQDRGYAMSWDRYREIAERVQDRFVEEDTDGPFKYQDGSWMRVFCDEWGAELPEDDLESIDAVFWEIKMQRQELVQGARKLLEYCDGAGLALGIVTNGNRRMTYSRLERTGIRELFDAIVYSTGVGAEKHALEPFQVVTDRLGVRPDECVMVGDQRDEDMAATCLGMRTVWVRQHAREQEKDPIEPDHAVEDLDGVREVINSYLDENNER